MPVDILNKGLPQDNYNGDFSERSILLHALKYYKTIKQDYVTRIFSGVRDEEKLAYISAVMITSDFFNEHYSKSATHKIFEIKPEVFKAVQEIGAENFLDKKIAGGLEEEHVRRLIKQQLELNVSKLVDEIIESPSMKRKELTSTISAVISAAGAIITALLMLTQSKC